MIKHFFKDKQWNLQYLWTLIGWIPNWETREFIELNCTDDEIKKIEYWYLAKLENWIIVLTWTPKSIQLYNTEYQRLRQAEYPPLWDQLDAIRKWWQEMEVMRQKVMSIKQKYPKPF